MAQLQQESRKKQGTIVIGNSQFILDIASSSHRFHSNWQPLRAHELLNSNITTLRQVYPTGCDPIFLLRLAHYILHHRSCCITRQILIRDVLNLMSRCLDVLDRLLSSLGSHHYYLYRICFFITFVPSASRSSDWFFRRRRPLSPSQRHNLSLTTYS